MSTLGKKRRYLTTSSQHGSDDDNGEHNLNKRHSSPAAVGFSSPRLIVSERQQLAVLKQLTAGDDSNTDSSSLIIPQQRPTKINRRNVHGETVVHIAARKGDLKQLKKVLKAGANVNEPDNAGWTPLHEAVTKNQFKAARLLLKSGANSNAPGPEGQTPLIDAVLNNNTKMVGLLLNNSADPSVLDTTRLNETLLQIFQQDPSTLDSSDNENDDDDDESISPSSPLTSADDSDHDEEKYDQNHLQSSLLYLPKIQQKKSYHQFHEHSSDSLSFNPTPTINNNRSKRNPYDFESEDDGHNKQRTISTCSTDSNNIKEYSISDDEHIHHIYRVPPLKIILARAVLQKHTDTESLNSFNMDDNSTMEISLPIIEENEKFLSTMSSNVTIPFTLFNNKVMTQQVNEDEKNNSRLSTLNQDQIISQSPQMIISTLLDTLIRQIDGTFNSSEEDKLIKKEKQNDLKTPTRTLRSQAQRKLNISISNQISIDNNNRRVSNRKRPLEKKTFLNPRSKNISERSDNNEDFQTSSNSDDPTIENGNEGVRSTINDESSLSSSIGGGDGTSLTVNTQQSYSNNVDIDSLPPNKRRLRERNAGILNSSSSSIPSLTTDTSVISNSSSIAENVPLETTIKDIPTNGIKQFLEIRQQYYTLRARFENGEIDRQRYLEGLSLFVADKNERFFIDKRHETMLHDFVLPKVPKDFSETLMAKKGYLIAPFYKSFSITTPASLGIKRLIPPYDLDLHLTDVFTRQEDERYKMKLRHQVEREKLILSHEQEILRLYGNATRSSINQDIPFSYCSLLKDNEVYNNPSIQERNSTILNNDYTNIELGKRGKHRWNGRSFIKWLEDSNLKYKRLSCEINQRQCLEANTLYLMQRMLWSKYLPKETPNLSSSGRMNTLLSERYLPKVEINTSFWTHWETSPF